MARQQKNNIVRLALGVFIFLLVIIALSFLYKPSINNENIDLSKKSTLQERGINPNPVIIRSVELKSSWEYNNAAYEVKKVYLAPDIADVGNWRDNFAIGVKNQFVVVEINIRDRRTSGESRLIDTSSFIRIKENNIESGPKDTENLYLKPQEESGINKIFVVSKESKEITFLTGLTSRPKVSVINFYGKNAVAQEGVFLYKTGFSTTYTE